MIHCGAAALAENYTNATPDVNYLKNTLVKIADSYNGITGNATLNQFGDRKYEDYDFWSVQESERVLMIPLFGRILANTYLIIIRTQ